MKPGINRLILALALPAIVTNITTPLLSLVDVAITGHMGGAAYIGAIAVGGSMFNMLYWLFGFLRMGTSGLTAQAFGAADGDASGRLLFQSLLVALAGGLLLCAVSVPVCEAALRFMEVGGVTQSLARSYFMLLIWGAPAVLANFAISGWLLGMQNSAATMWISLVINLVNIGASCALVYLAGMGIEGVAAGTLIAQWTGCLLGLAIIFRRYHPPVPALRRLVSGGDLRRFFSVNADIFLRTLCLVAVTVWFTRAGSRQGSEMLAVNALLMQFFTLFSYFMDGFAFAGEALTGRYIGARDPASLRRSVRALLLWGGAMAALFTLLYTAGGELLLRLLSDDLGVITAARDFMPWVLTIPAAGFMAFTYDGIFVGATATRSMLLSMAVASALFFIVCSIALPRMGNHGLWLAFILYLAARGAVLALLHPKAVHAPRGERQGNKHKKTKETE